MSRIRSVSALERKARAVATERARCRLRHQPKGIPGRPDYGNKARKVAVFIDGCWWHACPTHFRMPRTNTPFWRRKFARNVERRNEVRDELRRKGFRVVEVWEHDIKR